MPLLILSVDPDTIRRRRLTTALCAAGHVVAELDTAEEAVAVDVVVLPASTEARIRARLEAQLGSVPILDADAERVESLLVELAALERLASPLLRLEAVTVDLRRRLVVRDGTAQHLTEKEASLLGWLAANPLRAVSRAELLRNAWGASGDLLTRTVDVTVRRLREKIEADSSQPGHIITVHGEGYRFVPKQEPPEQRPVEKSAKPPSGLPFVGREAELAAIHDKLAHLRELGSSAHVVLLGPAGIGKTRLVREWARQQEVIWCDLSAAHTPALALGIVSRALGLPERSADPIDHATARLVDALSARGAVTLVLDGFQRAADTLGPLLETSQQRALPARFLVTTRRRPWLGDEHIIDLPPLPASDAAELFLQAARKIRHDYATRPEDQMHIDAIVRHLDCVPLALERAASRARILSPSDLLAELSRPSGRKAAVHAPLNSSWELLSEQERTDLTHLAVFRTPFDLEGAERVLAKPAPEILEMLLDRSLLRVIDAPGPRRFSLYESVRVYVAERHAQEITDIASERHASWLTERAELLAAASDGPDPWAAIEEMARLKEEFDAAAAWLQDRPRDAARVMLALAGLHETRGCSESDLAVLGAIAEVMREDHALRARLYLHRASMYLQRGLAEQAEADLDASEARSAAAALLRGRLEAHQGDLVEASEQLSFALEGELRVQIHALRALAAIAQRRGDLREAARTLDQAIAIARRSHRRWLSPLLADAAALELEQGQEILAEAQLRQTLDTYPPEPGPELAKMRRALGAALGQTGRFEEAKAHIETSAALCRSLGMLGEEGRASLALGCLQVQAGHSARALPEITRALAIAEETSDVLLAADAWAERARALRELGQLTLALDASRRALARYRALDLEASAVAALGDCAPILQELGHLNEADAAYAEAIDGIAQHLPRAKLMARHAALDLERGRVTEALDRLEQALQPLDEIERTRWEVGVLLLWRAVALSWLDRARDAAAALQAARARLERRRETPSWTVLELCAMHIEEGQGACAVANALPSSEIRTALRVLHGKQQGL